MAKYSIRKIAELANVSTATVSRVINNSSQVNEEKRKRILEIIKKTDYRPNQVARSLFKNSSKIIGFIVPNIINPFFSELGRYLEQEAFNKGYHVILCNSNNSYDKERFYIRNLESMNADGIIIIGNNTNESHSSEIPIIAIDREFSNSDDYISIRSDHYESGKLAAKHLYDMGCRNIALLSPFEGISSGRLKYQGYSDFCTENSLDEIVKECSYSFEEGVRNTASLIRENNKIDGIVCGNDIVAMACYKVLSNSSIRVPEDVKIIGYDNIIGSYMMTPAITTIAQPIEAIAKTTISYIIDTIEKKVIQNKQVIFPVKLVKRETT